MTTVASTLVDESKRSYGDIRTKVEPQERFLTEFCQLFQQMSVNSKDCIDPTSFYQSVLGWDGQPISLDRQGDAGDMLQLLLHRLDEACTWADLASQNNVESSWDSVAREIRGVLMDFTGKTQQRLVGAPIARRDSSSSDSSDSYTTDSSSASSSSESSLSSSSLSSSSSSSSESSERSRSSTVSTSPSCSTLPKNDKLSNNTTVHQKNNAQISTLIDKPSFSFNANKHKEPVSCQKERPEALKKQTSAPPAPPLRIKKHAPKTFRSPFPLPIRTQNQPHRDLSSALASATISPQNIANYVWSHDNKPEHKDNQEETEYDQQHQEQGEKMVLFDWKTTKSKNFVPPLPKYFIFHLKRFAYVWQNDNGGNGRDGHVRKLLDRCEVPPFLNVSPFVQSESEPTSSLREEGEDSERCVYSLTGAVVHAGLAKPDDKDEEEPYGGHYITFVNLDCDSNKDGRRLQGEKNAKEKVEENRTCCWAMFDDEKVAFVHKKNDVLHVLHGGDDGDGSAAVLYDGDPTMPQCAMLLCYRLVDGD